MDGLLSPVSTSYHGKEAPAVIQEVRTAQEPKSSRLVSTVNSAEDALELLKSELDYPSLISVLRYLNRTQADAVISITRPSPQSAQVTQVLVSQILPNYWNLLKEDSVEPGVSGKHSQPSELELFLRCLRSLAGLNAILIRLKTLIQDARSHPNESGSASYASLNLGIVLDALCFLLSKDDAVKALWETATDQVGNELKRKVLSQELLGILGGGRLLSLAAEAAHIIGQKEGRGPHPHYWIADAQEYTRWVGRNIVHAIRSEPTDEMAKFISTLLLRSIGLGHSDLLVKFLVQHLLLSQGSNASLLNLLLDKLPGTEQKKLLFIIIRLLSGSHLDRLGRCDSEKNSNIISSVAGAIQSIVGASVIRRGHLMTWLTSSSGAGIGEGIGIRRAVIAVVSQDRESVYTVLEQSMSQFGDQLYIKHSPVLQQEVHAQILLLSAGYLHRSWPIKLPKLMKTSVWLNTVSNRLSATHHRARLLGMIVGEAISSLVDSEDKRLNFHIDETNSQEGQWYKGLTRISDQLGPLEGLGQPIPEQPSARKKTVPRPVVKPATQPSKQGFIIEELDDGSDEDDDLVGYAKPDSDAEDSDDDPTLVQRNKPKAPVYIRDLIRHLRDTESYDHQKLALTTAPALIRRKANYGTEVSEHADELASLLVGLQDKFDIEDFNELRLQGMIAIVVAQPQVMGQWFGKTFFEGDYSLSQRAAILMVLGLSARELAGFDISGYETAAAFPSKRLPGELERLYLGPPAADNQPSSTSLKALPSNALEGIATSLTSAFLAPIAASAADKTSGPDVLKLSTFSSRLDSYGPKNAIQSRPTPRSRNIPNKTAQQIYEYYFSPLTARFRAALHSSASRIRGIIFQPYLLSLYLKTLGILLHAAGPSTLALPDMTSELWDILLSSSVRAHCVGDLDVTRGALFALMTLLEVNHDRLRDICRDMGREVVETQEWVAGVYNGIKGGDGDAGEENEAKGLAAAILVRLKEGIDKYQLLLAGDLIGS